MIRTEIRRVMDTLLVQDISLKAHNRVNDIMKKYSKMDEKVVFSLESLCEFANINQYDEIATRL